MKYKKYCVILATIPLIGTLLIGCENSTTKMVKETRDIYFNDIANKEEIALYYKDPKKQIPYVELRDWEYIEEKIYQEGIGDYPKDVNFKIDTTFDNNNAVLKRENNSTLTINFSNSSLCFSDFDRFVAHSYDYGPIELIHTTGYDEQSQPSYIKRVTTKYTIINGKSITIELQKYNIDFVHEGDKYYVPLQTISDILIPLQYCNILCNSQSVFVLDYDTALKKYSNLDPLWTLYYSDAEVVRSYELKQFDYNEICFIYDWTYGLKKEHDIVSFDDYFQRTSHNGKTLKELFLSNNPYEYELALSYLNYVDLNDVHSKYTYSSHFAGKVNNGVIKETGLGSQRNRLYDRYDLLENYRKEAYPSGMPSYEVIGNTAYITFDSFDNQTKDYYKTAPTANEDNAFGILLYAYKQIYTIDTHVENVVLDLSQNGGGCEDALAFTLGMFLGEYSFSIKNPITGCISENRYRIDANLDHVFDDHDWFYDKQLFCLTSIGSFSCGNAVPCVFKNSRNITLLGERSGGGACVVEPLTSMSGSYFRTSGYKHIVVNDNGSYYSVDSGAEVDYKISDFASYYNRNKLTTYINSLL